MELKYSKHFQTKLEELISEAGFELLYGKGNFKSGYCFVKDSKVVVVNKYYSIEGKINCLVDIIKEIAPDPEKLQPTHRKLASMILQKTIEF